MSGTVSDRKNRRLIEYALYLSCILSNISQLPFFVSRGLTQQIAFPGWILLLILILIFRGIKIRKVILPQLALAFMLLLWLLVDSLLSAASFFSSSMIYSYLISFFIFLLGSWVADDVDKRVLNHVVLLFCASMVIVTAAIFVQYFGIGYSLATRIYAYGSKNSVSQLIFTVIILLIMRIHPNRMIWRLLKLLVIVFELYVIMLLRSRATLVGLILSVFVIVFSKKTRKGIKFAVAVSGLIVIFFLLTNDTFNHFIFDNVLFANRSITNLNDLTSGRVDIISSFPGLISGHWLTGIGSTYFECFPLSALLQFGIIGGGIIIVISLSPLTSSIYRMKASAEWFLLLLISLGYSINGLFEGLTPFGPGVKCYFMWLLYGVLLSCGTCNGNEDELS